ncbi:MAG TPA: P-loop NTPase [Clostridia bacterium]|nr:P-loop NTPase [Clostridia bacterium]
MILAVASGKGGTGKTTIAVNLAWSLQAEMPVQLLDCDVEEPNVSLFLKPSIRSQEKVFLSIPEIDREKCDHCGVCARFCAFGAISVLGDHVLTFPELCHGCGGCALFCPTEAITEQLKEIGTVETGDSDRIEIISGKLSIGSVLAPTVIRAVKEKKRTQGLVIVDAPPGTSCPAVASVANSDYCLLVTEPTPFGLHDLNLAAGMVRELGIPVGVVINRWQDFQGVDIENYCRQEGIPVLLKIPFDRRVAACYARGGLPAQEFSLWQDQLKVLWSHLERRLES